MHDSRHGDEPTPAGKITGLHSPVSKAGYWHKVLRLVALSAVPLIASTAGARAQSSEPNTTATTSAPEQDPEITLQAVDVTAEQSEAGPNLFTPVTIGSRLFLTPLETPASVEVINNQVMINRGQTSINEAIAANATGITFMGVPGNGNSALTMRGFAGHSSITRLYDGVRLYPGSNTVTFPFDTWTAERIEILHGPASVLFGEGGIGGAINVVPNKPLFDRQRNEALAMIGTNATYQMALGSAGPLGDTFAYSFDISGRGTQGWLDRGEANSLAVSGGLGWKVNEDLELRFSYDYGFNEPLPYSGTPLVGGHVFPAFRRINFGLSDALVRYKDTFTQLHAVWTPTDQLTINSRVYYIGTDRDWRNAEGYTWNTGLGRVIRNQYSAIGQDMSQVGMVTDATLQSRLFGMANETIFGFEANSISYQRSTYFPTRSDILNPFAFDPGVFGYNNIRTVLDSDTRQFALFTDSRLEITDQFSLVGGFRYDNPHVKVVNPTTGSSFSTTLDNTNWRIGAVYEPVKDISLYAQYSQATDPFGSIVSAVQNQADLKLPTGTQYEAGIKAALFDGRVQMTFAAYRIEKQDLLSIDPLDPKVTNQIGAQSSEGLEASVGIDFSHGFRLDANGTVLRARFDDYIQAGGDFTGNTPANVPLQSANIWASWNFLPDWTVYGGINYVGEAYADDANTVVRPEYTITNAGLRWKATSSVTLSIHAQNLFDEVYAVQAYGLSRWVLGAPRTVNFSLYAVF